MWTATSNFSEHFQHNATALQTPSEITILLWLLHALTTAVGSVTSDSTTVSLSDHVDTSGKLLHSVSKASFFSLCHKHNLLVILIVTFIVSASLSDWSKLYENIYSYDPICEVFT